MVEAAALEHWLMRWWLDTGDLKWMQDRMRTDLKEDVAQTVFLQVKRHLCPKDTPIEGNKPIHIGGNKGQMIDTIEQKHSFLQMTTYVFVLRCPAKPGTATQKRFAGRPDTLWVPPRDPTK